MKKNNSKETQDLKFEEGLERLEEIITVLEKGEMSLEDSIGHFREGSKLFRHLQGKLTAAEGEVKTILSDFEEKPLVKEQE